MKTNTLTIQLKPSFNLTAEKLGYNLETDDIDSDAISFQQGYDIDEIEVEPGEKFTIPPDYEGSISCEEVNYKLSRKDWNGKNEVIEDEEFVFLDSGKYLFHEDGITIENLSEIF